MIILFSLPEEDKYCTTNTKKKKEEGREMIFDGSETIPVPNKNEIRLEKSMTMIPNNYGLVFPICQFQ